MRNFCLYAFALLLFAQQSSLAVAATDLYAEPPGPGVSSPATEKELAQARATYRNSYFDLVAGYSLVKALYWAGRYGDARMVVSDVSMRPGSGRGKMTEFESVFFPVSPEEKKFRDAAGALKNEKEVEALLKTFVAEHPDQTPEFLAYGFMLWQSGRKPETEALVSATLAKNPANAGAITLQGALRLDEKKFDEAIAILKKAVQLDHANAYAFQKLASLLVNEKKETVTALPYLGGHIILSPGEAFPWAGRQEERIHREYEKALLAGGPTPEKIRGFLASQNGNLRMLGCRLAAGSSEVSHVDRLLELLDDDADSIRHCAGGALVQIGAKHPGEVMKGKDKVLTGGKPFAEGVFLAVAATLLPEKDAVPLLLARLQHPNSYVRFEAAGILGIQRFRKNAEAKAALAKFFSSEKDTKMLEVRKAASESERSRRLNQATNRAYMMMSSRDIYDGPKPPETGPHKLAADAAKKLEARDFAGAEKGFLEAFAADPKQEILKGKDLALAQLGLSKAYLEAGKLDEAEYTLAMANIIGQNAESVEAAYLLACLHGDLEENDKAEHHLKQVVERTKGKPELRARYVKQARAEPRLAKLRATPAFEKALVETAPIKKSPRN